MEAWQSVASLKEFEEYTIVKAPVPDYEEDAYNLAFQKCKENKCGCFNTNWGCNPAAKMDVATYYQDIDYVLVVYREFDVDRNDQEILRTISEGMQRNIRRMVLQLRDNGLDCDGYLDGPCRYCGECAYPQPCRFPDMMIPSVSTLGINLKEYFAGIGKHYSLQESTVTLYGFIFVHYPI
jgi:predicted metal-binding protein